MLHTFIGHSEDPDEQSAVKELVAQCQKQLGGRQPQAGILYAALDYNHQLILQLLNDAFPNIQLIGCTTDGEISSLLHYKEDSLTFLALHGEGIELKTGLGRDLSKDLKAATHQAAQSAKAQCTLPPKLCLIAPESMTVSSTSLLSGLQDQLGVAFPIFGGIAADQWRFEKTYQFYGNEVLTDALPLLLFAGPIDFSHGIASGWEPFGKSGTVTSAKGNTIESIDHKPALEFYKHYLGDHVKPSGEYPLAVSDPHNNEGAFLRAPLAYDETLGSITFAGDVPQYSNVQLTAPERDKILEACKTSATQAFDNFPKGKQPACALLISCAARKYFLGTKTKGEYELIKSQVQGIPTFGFYAYGEIGPLHHNSPSRFHNETFVTLLIG